MAKAAARPRKKEKKVVVWPDDLAQSKILFPTPPWSSR